MRRLIGLCVVALLLQAPSLAPASTPAAEEPIVLSGPDGAEHFRALAQAMQKAFLGARELSGDHMIPWRVSSFSRQEEWALRVSPGSPEQKATLGELGVRGDRAMALTWNPHRGVGQWAHTEGGSDDEPWTRAALKIGMNKVTYSQLRADNPDLYPKAVGATRMTETSHRLKTNGFILFWDGLWGRHDLNGTARRWLFANSDRFQLVRHAERNIILEPVPPVGTERSNTKRHYLAGPFNTAGISAKSYRYLRDRAASLRNPHVPTAGK